MKKKALLVVIAAGVLSGAWYTGRVWPVFTTDNSGAEKVVLLHGLGRNEQAMWLLESTLLDAGYDVYNISYPSRHEPPDVLLDMVSADINGCCNGPEKAVHFVGHSLGGLLARDYLAHYSPENLGRVILIGTPNKGSELADVELDEEMREVLERWAGPSATALHTGPDGYPASLPPPDYPVGIIAGTNSTRMSDRYLPVPNDGAVSVDSAKLDGMTDFIMLDVAHWDLRGDRKVAEQVVFFLENGRFNHANSGSPPADH
jgi:pimeloyl-ACP methyl ester carboxylesterase